MVAMVAVKVNSVKPLFDSHSISHDKQCRKGKTLLLTCIIINAKNAHTYSRSKDIKHTHLLAVEERVLSSSSLEICHSSPKAI